MGCFTAGENIFADKSSHENATTANIWSDSCFFQLGGFLIITEINNHNPTFVIVFALFPTLKGKKI